LSEKQVQAAINGMKREGIDIESLANQKSGRTYSDLVKEMKDLFVEILNNKIEND
jgi:biotin operon repressor